MTLESRGSDPLVNPEQMGLEPDLGQKGGQKGGSKWGQNGVKMGSKMTLFGPISHIKEDPGPQKGVFLGSKMTPKLTPILRPPKSGVVRNGPKKG